MGDRVIADVRTDLQLLARVLAREQGVLAEDPSVLPSHMLQTLRLDERSVPEGLTRRAVDALRGRVWLELLERPPGFTSAIGELARWELGAPVSAVTVSPFGDGLATLRLDGRLQVRFLPWAQPAWDVQAHDGPAEDLDWSCSGRLLVTGDDAGAVALWDARTGIARGAWPAHPSEGPTTVRWGPDDSFVVSCGGDGAIRFWRLTSRGAVFDAECVHEMRSRDASTTRAFEWSPDGRRFATGGQDAAVRIWDMDTSGPMLRAELEENDHGVTGLAWDPAATRLASCAADGAICLWDLLEGSARVLRSGGPADPTRAIAWSRDGSRIAFDADAYRLGLIDPETMALTFLTGHKNLVFALAWTHDRKLVSGSIDTTARLWDPTTATPEDPERRRHDTMIGSGIALSHDGDRLATGDYGSSMARSFGGTASAAEVHPCNLIFWGVEDGAPIPGENEHFVFRGITSIAWSPNDRQVSLCCRDGSVATVDAETGGGRERWLAHQSEVWRAAWGPGGRIATAGQDGEIVVWGAEGALSHHSAGAPVRALAWSPDGARIAAGCDGGALICLHADDLSLVWERSAHEHRVHGLTWSEDARTLLSAGADGLILVWDAEDGTPLVGHRHSTQVYAAAFVPPGRWVCSGGDSGMLDLWEVASGRLVARAYLPGSVGDIVVAPDGRLQVASHGSENGFRPVVYGYALRLEQVGGS